MNKKVSLKDKIVKSVYVYETKKITIETVIQILILLISLGILFIFGGVISDLFIENEIGDLLNGFIKAQGYSFAKILELNSIIGNEIPQWLLLFYIGGLMLGCILIVSIIKNWKLIAQKTRLLVSYWFKL